MSEISIFNIWYFIVLGMIASYFIGCFNFAVFISKFKHRNITEEGSGNPGTMNMARTFGLKIGILTLVCDAIKGGVPVLCGYLLFKNYCFLGTTFVVSDITRYLFGLCAVVGHIFPVTMKFKGGKGIASTVGVFLFGLSCEYWWLSILVIGYIVLLFMWIYVFEWGGMASLIIVSTLAIFQILFFIGRNETTTAYYIISLMLPLAINVLTWYKHHENIFRMFAGEEHRTSVKKMLAKKRKKST